MSPDGHKVRRTVHKVRRTVHKVRRTVHKVRRTVHNKQLMNWPILPFSDICAQPSRQTLETSCKEYKLVNRNSQQT